MTRRTYDTSDLWHVGLMTRRTYGELPHKNTKSHILHSSHKNVIDHKKYTGVNVDPTPLNAVGAYNNNNNNNLVWWHCHRVALYKMWYKLKSACSVLSMLNQIDVFLSALQMYLNQKRKTSNQQAKHSNSWGQPPQKISNPSQSDDWVQHILYSTQWRVKVW